MRSLSIWVVVAAFVPGLTVAQDRSVAEIGTSLGLTIQSAGGNTLTHFGIPGQGILGQPTIYASIFTRGGLLVEPQVAFNLLSSGGSTVTTVGIAGDLGYLFNGPDASSGYLAGGATLQAVSGGGSSDSEFALGARVGYRAVVGSGLAVRVEGGYRRWLDAELNEFRIGLGIGGVVRRPG